MSAPTQTAPEELRVSSPAEITAYLQQLQREGAGLTLSGPPGASLSSRIVALDPAADLLGLEIGTDPEGISQALVAGGEITAVAYLGTIKLQFELEAPVIVSGEQGAVLRTTLPTRLYRFQRRQSFRVQPAGSVYPRVLVPGGAQPGRALRVALLPHHDSPISGDATGTRQLGCAFVDLDAAAGRSLQVYVDQTQKRRRLLKLDL